MLFLAPSPPDCFHPSTEYSDSDVRQRREHKGFGSNDETKKGGREGKKEKKKKRKKGSTCFRNANQ
jgi:hypothetical protein